MFVATCVVSTQQEICHFQIHADQPLVFTIFQSFKHNLDVCIVLQYGIVSFKDESIPVTIME